MTSQPAKVTSDAKASNSKLPTVTVVVPIHNEADYLPVAVPKLFGELEAVEADWKVLLVENGSVDDTVEVVQKLSLTYKKLNMLELSQANYGAALREGFFAAEGEWVVCFDIDYFSGEFLDTALRLEGHPDVVVGSKRAPGSDDRRSVVRRLITWQLNLILRLTVGLKASDTHGIKAVRRTAIDAVLKDVVSIDDLFDTELVIRAERHGLSVVEVPVVVKEDRESKSAIWKRVPRTVKGIWNLRAALNKDSK